jgi:hypothetical protein
MKFHIDSWMIGWTPTWVKDEPNPGAIEVGPWPDTTRWSDAYVNTSGCCNAGWDELTSSEQKMDEIIRGFYQLVLADGIDAFALHLEFCKIDGYLDYEGSIGFGGGTAIFFQDGRLSPYNP